MTSEEMKERQFWKFTWWINTLEDELCVHCIRIISLRLCIDKITDCNYWKYMNTTALETIRLQEKCVNLYRNLFQEYEEMGGQL